MGKLAGQRIVVTRAIHQSADLAQPLEDLGAKVIVLPTIAIVPPSDTEPLRRAAAGVDEFDWIIFTSTNAVAAFAAELRIPAAALKAGVATVGAATREAAEQCGFRVAITPEKYVAESLVEAFRSRELEGKRLLLPSAAVTRDVVASELGKCGAEVTVVEAYRNVVPAEAIAEAPRIFCEPYPDWVTFTSSSAFDNLFRLVGAEPLSKVKIASIGPITSERVRRRGLQVSIEASVHSIEGLIVALSDY